jgi:3-hexulose-6-phosphate synthase/6-phospho-3-hexuloisomerase
LAFPGTPGSEAGEIEGTTLEIRERTRDALEVVGGLHEAGTGTIGNTLHRMGIPGIAHGLHPIEPGVRFLGIALTVKAICDPNGAFSEEDFDLGPAIDALSPGDVLVFDNGGHAFATMGGIAALAAKLRGATGVVADGALRDIDEMIDVGLPAYTRHAVLPSGVGYVKFIATNVDVNVGGVTVKPGDIVAADVGGLVVIPAARAREVGAAVKRVMDRDKIAAEFLREGRSFSEVIRLIRAPDKPLLAK